MGKLFSRKNLAVIAAVELVLVALLACALALTLPKFLPAPEQVDYEDTYIVPVAYQFTSINVCDDGGFYLTYHLVIPGRSSQPLVLDVDERTYGAFICHPKVRYTFHCRAYAPSGRAELIGFDINNVFDERTPEEKGLTSEQSPNPSDAYTPPPVAELDRVRQQVGRVRITRDGRTWEVTDGPRVSLLLALFTDARYVVPDPAEPAEPYLSVCFYADQVELCRIDLAAPDAVQYITDGGTYRSLILLGSWPAEQWDSFLAQCEEMDGLPWAAPTAAAQDYDAYFAQLTDYHYAGQDADWNVLSGGGIAPFSLAYDGSTLWLEGGSTRQKVADFPGLQLICYDRSWIYAIIGGTELFRMDYFGENHQVLFIDDTGLMAETAAMLADGQVLYFWAGLPEGGAALCRLYAPEARADAMLTLTSEELEEYWYTPPDSGAGAPLLLGPEAQYLLGPVLPVSSHECTWTTVNRNFAAHYDAMAAHPEDYPQYFAQGWDQYDIIGHVEADLQLKMFTDHYYNAQTGEYLRQPSSGYSNAVSVKSSEIKEPQR